MDLEGLAERLRHEMELIIETELVLGSTALSHSYFLQVENLRGLMAMGSQKPRARKRFRNHVWAVLFARGSTSQGTTRWRARLSATSVEKDAEESAYVNPIRVLNTK
jgi:short subunit dehydrogenase-like uncharacterized protein